MSVCLINPPSLYYKMSDMTLPHSLGLLYIAAYLRKHQVQTTVIEATFEGRGQHIKDRHSFRVGLSISQIIERIPFDAKMVGISIEFGCNAKFCHDLVDEIKAKRPDLQVVLGGSYPSTQPELALESSADYIVIGEGESAVYQLYRHISGEIGALPAGVATRHSGRVDGVVFENLDDLPFPARDLIPIKEINREAPYVRGRRMISLVTSRGCPFNCSFCSIHSVHQHHYRKRSLKNVIDELYSIVEDRLGNHISILDDLIGYDVDRFKEIIEGFIEINKKYDLSWDASLRIDLASRSLLERVSRSNCKHLNLHLENGSAKMLELMNKQLNLNTVLEVFSLIREYKIKVYCHVIYGYPGETEELFREALTYYKKLVKINPSVFFCVQLAQPYPGTKLFAECIEEGYISNQLCKTVEGHEYFNTAYTSFITTPDFDKDVLLRRELQLYWIFNKRIFLKLWVRRILPSKWWNLLRELKSRSKGI